MLQLQQLQRLRRRKCPPSAPLRRPPSEALVRTPDGVRREEGNVLVCTDAAARGLDIPAVSHIVQADFAATAVDFLHRVSDAP